MTISYSSIKSIPLKMAFEAMNLSLLFCHIDMELSVTELAVVLKPSSWELQGPESIDLSHKIGPFMITIDFNVEFAIYCYN